MAEGVDSTAPRWRLELAESPQQSAEFSYDVAGLGLDSVVPLAVPWGAERTVPPPARLSEGSPPLELLWRGRGWLGGIWREVTSRGAHDRYRLEIEGFGAAEIERVRRTIRVSPAARTATRDLSDALAQEIVLGPVVALALAFERTFCLHAGAVLVEGSVVAFLGESGCGKSTLAHPDGESWRRVADDVLPIRELAAHPRFPQLKLERGEQYPTDAAPTLPLAALLLLAPEEAGAFRGRVTGTPLSTRAATLALVRHSVATKLFGAELLKRHLEWCEEVARAVPVLQWSYPHDIARLDEVRERVRETVANLRS